MKYEDQYEEIIKILKDYKLDKAVDELEKTLEETSKDFEGEEAYNYALLDGMPWFDEILAVVND